MRTALRPALRHRIHRRGVADPTLPSIAITPATPDEGEAFTLAAPALVENDFDVTSIEWRRTSASGPVLGTSSNQGNDFQITDTLTEPGAYQVYALLATSVGQSFTRGPFALTINQKPWGVWGTIPTLTEGVSATIPLQAGDYDGTVQSITAELDDGTQYAADSVTNTGGDNWEADWNSPPPAGSYTLRMTITDDNGATTTVAQAVTVEAVQASFPMTLLTTYLD